MLEEKVNQELEKLDSEKKIRTLKFIQREKEAGRNPSTEEILEIIQFLKGKSEKSFQKSNSINDNSNDEQIAIGYERPVYEFIKLFNCSFCHFVLESKCNQSKSPLYKKEVLPTLLCSLFEERD